VTLAELTPARIREFAAKLEAEGLSAGYRRRILGDFAAAMNRAFKDGEVATPPPHVPLPPEGPGNKRVASIAELTELFRAARHPHVLSYLMVALGSAARPAAILDPDKAQCDLASRTIELLPPGRAPDPSKRRPTVPMCLTLTKFIADDRAPPARGIGVGSRRTPWPSQGKSNDRALRPCRAGPHERDTGCARWTFR
jgi:hypothetical protein